MSDVQIGQEAYGIILFFNGALLDWKIIKRKKIKIIFVDGLEYDIHIYFELVFSLPLTSLFNVINSQTMHE